MRLRRESGDFSINIVDAAATIRPNLNAGDLIGAIITSGTVTAVVTAITTGDGTLTLTAGSASYTYTVATGAIATVV